VPYSILESFQDEDYTQSSRFVHLWKLIILVELSKLTILNQTLDSVKENRLRSIIECVSPDLGASTEAYLKYTKSKEFQMSLPKFISSKSTSATEGDKISLLDYVSALQEELVKSAPITCTYTVVLDELDDSYGSSTTYINMLISMFKAVYFLQ